MPDLPLPKPQPPQAPTQVAPVSSVNQDDDVSLPSPSLSTQSSSTVTPVPASTAAVTTAPPSKTYSPALQSTTVAQPTVSPVTANRAPSVQTELATNPAGSLQSPAMAPPMKPPAVVTALSSVSSHQIPPQLDSSVVTPEVASNMHATPSLAAPISQTLPPSLHTPTSTGAAPNPTTLSLGSTQAVAQSTQPALNQPVSLPPTPLRPTPPAVPGSQPPTTSSQPTKNTTLTTPPQPSSPSPTSPVIAKPKKSKKGIIFLIIGIVIGLLVIGGVAMALLTKPSTQSASTDSSGNTTGTDQGANVTVPQTSPSPVAVETTLEYWGLWEPSEVLNSVLTEFQKQNPTIAVRYVQQSYKDYRERLQTAIASGNGPDLFRYHASWVPMLKAELEPLPAAVMSPSDFAQTFYPIASKQLQLDGQLVGIPLEYDGLVLYYNQDILETAGIQPPKTWSELRDAARNLKIPKTGSPLQRGGLAIGTAENVDHFADIIAVLMLQNGADLQQPNSPEGRDALLFYTNFATQDQVWSADLPSSTVAFARGDVAMMFAPSWRAFEIAQQNPNLRFATVPLPQLPNTKVTWGTYWAEGVSQQSKSKDAAWKLLKYLSSKDVQQKLYTSQAQVRAFGEPYSRVDLADQLASNKVVGPILQDAPNALGWYMSTLTHDNGINDQINTYYKDAVNSILQGNSVEQVLQTLQLGVNQVLGNYGLAAPVTPTEAPKTY